MSVLSEIFGNCPQLKIIETFAENYNDKLYAADIARMTDVNKATVHSHITKLLKEGLIEKKEKIANIQFYQLNLDNPKAKMILTLENYIVYEGLKKLDVEDIEEKIEITVSKSTIPELATSKSATPDPVYREFSSPFNKYKKKRYPFRILEIIGNYATNVPDRNDILKNSKVTTYG